MTDEIAKITMDHTAPVQVEQPVLHSEPVEKPRQEAQPGETQHTVTTTTTTTQVEPKKD